MHAAAVCAARFGPAEACDPAGGPGEPRVLSSALPSYLRPGSPATCRSTIRSPTSGSSSPTRAFNPNNPNSPLYTNAGQDRLGHRPRRRPWTITVHGPGKVIVTDTTPNDGVLDDDINTIQLVGTNPNTTYVTG